MLVTLNIEKASLETFTLNVQADDSIWKAKINIEKLLGSPPENMRLYLNNDLLENEKRISDYKLNTGDNLKVFTRITFRIKFVKRAGDNPREINLSPWENETNGDLLETISKILDIEKSYLTLKSGNQSFTLMEERLCVNFQKYASANIESRLLQNSVGFKYYNEEKKQICKYIEIEKNMTISEVKKKVGSKLEMMPNSFNLFYNSQLMENNIQVGIYITNDLYNEKVYLYRILPLYLNVEGDNDLQGPVEYSEKTNIRELKESIVQFLKLDKCDIELKYKDMILNNPDEVMLIYWIPPIPNYDNPEQTVKMEERFGNNEEFNMKAKENNAIKLIFNANIMYMIRVNFLSDHRIVSINKQDRISLFKRKILQEFGIEEKTIDVDCYDLFFNTELLEDKKFIQDYALSGNSTILFDPKLLINLMYYETKKIYHYKMPRKVSVKELSNILKYSIKLDIDRQSILINNKEVSINDNPVDQHLDNMTYIVDGILERLIQIQIKYKEKIIGKILVRKQNLINEVKNLVNQECINTIPVEFMVLSDSQKNDFFEHQRIEDLKINENDILLVRDGRIQVLAFFEDKSLFYETEILETRTVAELKVALSKVLNISEKIMKLSIENEGPLLDKTILLNITKNQFEIYKKPLEVKVEIMIK